MRTHANNALADTKVNEVTAVAPVPTKLNVNLCDGGDFRVTERIHD